MEHLRKSLASAMVMTGCPALADISAGVIA
jgi:isopentenyl diphosphate isomerase/L-lactate dehydrogenase-like FMN-dependent dehydrogenase